MQPCPVCGGVDLDAAGYCTRCGTFRGVPQQPVPPAPYAPAAGLPPAAPFPPPAAPYAPPAGPPAAPFAPAAGLPPAAPFPPGGTAAFPPAAPYPGAVPPPSAPPYAPGSGVPYQPASGVPYQPTSGGPYAYPPVSGVPGAPPISGPPVSGYPGYPAPPPPRKSSFGLLVGVAAAVILLVAAIVVVIVVKSNKSGKPVAGASPTAAASPSSLVDACVVGTWKVTSDQHTVDFGGSYGKITVTSVDTYTTKLRADGTGLDDLGDATVFQSEVNGNIYTVAFSGTDTYSYRTSGGTMTFSGTTANGHWVTMVNDKVVGSGSTVGTSDPVQYTCSGDTMTEQSGSDFSAQMTRTSHTA